METEQIYVKNDGTGMDRALKAAEKLADDLGLERREAMHMRLLVEETFGMVRAITGIFQALFWIDYEPGEEYSIRLEAKTQMYAEKRDDLLAVSTRGKNSANKGIMGKIRGLFETALINYREVTDLQADYGIVPVAYGSMGIDASSAMSQAVTTWTLQNYRNSIKAANIDAEAETEVWDELERSIVANIADDIMVGIRMDTVDMTILKKL